MRKASLYLAFAIVAAFAKAEGPGTALVPSGDDAYGYVEALAFSAGVVPLSSDEPRSEKSLMAELDAIEPSQDAASENLSRALAELLRKRPLLEKPESEFKIGISVSPEVYLCDPASSIPYWRGYGDRSSIISVPIDFSFEKAFAIGGLLDLRQNPDAEGKALNPENYFNIPKNLGYYDFRLPLRSYAAAGGDFWSLRICREQVDWGAARDAIYLADTAGFIDHFYGEISLPNFSYGLFAASLDAREEGSRGAPLAGNYNDVPRTFLVHRLQARFFKRIRIALNEGIMVGGIYPDLRYFNPLYIFHDSFAFDHATSFTGAEIEAVPWKYFSIYAAGAANQIQSSFETSTYPTASSIPNAFAWQTGIKAYIPMGKGIWDGTAEFIYANPWMYIRESPSTSYSNEHYLGSNVPGSTGYDFPCLGLESGPDSMVAELRIEYKLPRTMEASLLVEYLIKGEQDLSTPYAEGETATAMVTPTGTPEMTLTIGVEGSWRMLPCLSLGLSLAYLDRSNAGHSLGDRDRDIQASLKLDLDVLALVDSINSGSRMVSRSSR
jgi:hypothetical protein